MEVRFEGAFTKEEFVWLYRKSMELQWRKRLTRMGLLLLGPFIASLYLDSRSNLGIGWVIIVPYIAILLGELVDFAVAYFPGANKAWAQQSGHAHVAGVFSEGGFVWTTRVSEMRGTWEVFSGWRTTKDFLFLYQGESLNTIPREFFATDDDWEAARALVRQKIPTT